MLTSATQTIITVTPMLSVPTQTGHSNVLANQVSPATEPLPVLVSDDLFL